MGKEEGEGGRKEWFSDKNQHQWMVVVVGEGKSHGRDQCQLEDEGLQHYSRLNQLLLSTTTTHYYFYALLLLLLRTTTATSHYYLSQP